MFVDLEQFEGAICPEFHAYAKPEVVGWAGWVADLGETLAYVGLDGEVVRHVDTPYDELVEPPDEDDPADWWKST